MVFKKREKLHQLNSGWVLGILDNLSPGTSIFGQCKMNSNVVLLTTECTAQSKKKKKICCNKSLVKVIKEKRKEKLTEKNLHCLWY